jgi:hypothetical protein
LKKGLMVTFALAAAGALFVFAAAGQVGRAQPDFRSPPEPTVDAQAAPTAVWQCYDVQRGDDPQEVVRLVTENFGGDRVRVRNLILMCELAFKVRPVLGVPDPPPPTDADTRILACYRLELGGDPNDPYQLDTANFGTDGVIVRQSQLMCEEASKTRVFTDPNGSTRTVTTGQPTGQTWQCYTLRLGADPQLSFRLITNNFGRDDVEVRRSGLMCETSAKFKQDAAGNVLPFGEATGEVLQCFRLLDGADPNIRVTLGTANFGPDEILIRRSNSMCEAAEKEPVFIAGVAFPDDEP